MRHLTKTIAATIALVVATTIAGIVGARPAGADTYCISWEVVVGRAATTASTTSTGSTEATAVDEPGEGNVVIWLGPGGPGGPSRVCLWPIRP